MDALSLFRKAQQKIQAKVIGLDIRQNRVLTGQMGTTGNEAYIRTLPVSMTTWEPLQNSSGSFYFMNDYSQVDGEDILQ